MKNNKWSRICPKCNSVITYSKKWNMDDANMHNRMCNSCSLKINHDSLKFTIEQFISKANILHEGKYRYSISKYSGSLKDIKINCQIHGDFVQKAHHHLSGHGCPKCKNDKLSGENSSTTNEFIKKASVIHNNKYDYSDVTYKNRQCKINIICPLHGNFTQSAGGHLNGKGCLKCIHKISKPEIEFLNYLNIDIKNRQKYIKPYHIDGLENNIVYEFLGDYYHGNPEIFNSDDYNKVCHTTFGVLFNKTFLKLNTLKNMGYSVKYIWENDWNKYKKGIDKIPSIITI